MIEACGDTARYLKPYQLVRKGVCGGGAAGCLRGPAGPARERPGGSKSMRHALTPARCLALVSLVMGGLVSVLALCRLTVEVGFCAQLSLQLSLSLPAAQVMC